MGKEKEKNIDNKSTQFRWAPQMERLLLETLAEEAQLGNKPSNTFRHSSFVRVATLVKERFIGSQCEPKHVENRLKTIKGLWNTITRLRNKSGFGWDDNMKMITCSKENFDDEIMAHPTHEKFLNKKIELYDEMSLVVGKDMATGAYAKSFNDIDVEVSIENSFAQDIECNEFEEVRKPKEVSTSTSSKPRSHQKRPREDRDSSFDLLAGQVGEVASAIKKLSDDNVNTEDLYKEVMKVEGFDEEFLGSVFDHLNANTSLTKGFMVKSQNLRRKWIEKFIANEWQY